MFGLESGKVLSQFPRITKSFCLNLRVAANEQILRVKRFKSLIDFGGNIVKWRLSIFLCQVPGIITIIEVGIGSHVAALDGIFFTSLLFPFIPPVPFVFRLLYLQAVYFNKREQTGYDREQAVFHRFYQSF